MLKLIAIAIVLFVVLSSCGYDEYDHVKIDHLHSFITYDNGDKSAIIVTNHVIDIQRSSDFIVATRIVTRDFECKQFRRDEGYIKTNHMIFTDTLEYWVIEISSNTTFSTTNRQDFLKYLDTREILNLVTTQHIVDTNIGKPKKWAFIKKWRNEVEKKVKDGECIEVPVAYG